MPRRYRAFSEQLTTALSDTGVSQRELAKRLAKLDGTKPESKRRWLGKLLSGDVEPGPASVGLIEQGLSLDGYFTRPAVRPAIDRRNRLAALEAEVTSLREEHEAALQAVVVRLAELEAALAQPERRSTLRTSAKARQQR